MAKKVFLSAGHGGSDPGAVGYNLKEKNINLRILLKCKDELERHGVKVICSRTKDENDPVGEEVKEANKSGAKVAISFHTNAGGGDGSETYYYTLSTAGKKLANLCEKHTKAIGQNSRGIKSGNHLRFVNSTSMVAVLCECAFIDNKADVKIIDTAAEQDAFGLAYAKAALEYLGIKYKEPVKTVYKVQVGAYSKKANATTLQKAIKKDGFDATVVKVGKLYKVQVGAYSKKTNATNMQTKLKKAGYDAIIVRI